MSLRNHMVHVHDNTCVKHPLSCGYGGKGCLERIFTDSTNQCSISRLFARTYVTTTKIAGLYYQFFKRLAWEGISLYEVVSTTNEFTILVEDDVVDKAFSAVKSLKN